MCLLSELLKELFFSIIFKNASPIFEWMDHIDTCGSITTFYLIPKEVAFQDAFRAFSMHAMLQIFGKVLYSLCTGSKRNPVDI